MFRSPSITQPLIDVVALRSMLIPDCSWLLYDAAHAGTMSGFWTNSERS